MADEFDDVVVGRGSAGAADHLSGTCRTVGVKAAYLVRAG